MADSLALARVAARLGLRPAVGFGARVADSRHGRTSRTRAIRRRSLSTRRRDRRYNLSDFQEYLDDTAIPDPEAQEKAAREWAERFADKPLVINTDARIPQEMLDGWMAADMRFKNTWLRQRHDLKDQSQSGYDLALANFGTEAGLTEQQIVDLIIHHRRQYGQKPRTRLDYFQRTIAKASRQSPGADAPAVLPARRLQAPRPATLRPRARTARRRQAESRNSASPDPATAKALLCQQISADPGCPDLPPREVHRQGADLPHGTGRREDRVPQRRQVALAELRRAGNRRTSREGDPRLKPKVWDAIGASDAGRLHRRAGRRGEPSGKARRGCTLRSTCRKPASSTRSKASPYRTQRKPIVLDGKIGICASDLQMYINKTTFQTLSVKAVASMLGALGGKNIRVRGANFREQSRWMLPTDQFDPTEYSPQKEETNVQ